MNRQLDPKTSMGRWIDVFSMEKKGPKRVGFVGDFIGDEILPS